MERELDTKDNKIIGKIKKIEAQIHQSYQQDSDGKNENKSSPFPAVSRTSLHLLRRKTSNWRNSLTKQT